MPQDTKEKASPRSGFMSQEEMRMVDDFLTKIEHLRGAYGEFYDRWDKEEEAYLGDQEIEENSPNTRVNIVNAVVESEVAALVEQNLTVTCRGEGPSDQGFADWARIGLDWTLRKNHIKRVLDRHERRRELFGTGWLKVSWDADAVNGFGLATITCPPLQSVFVDGKVGDPFDLQKADYIAEVMERSKTYAETKYGDMAKYIHFGGSDEAAIFQKRHTTDDKDAFWLVQIWTMSKPKGAKKAVLRLIECSDDGVLLFDSFKKWNGRRFVERRNPKPFYAYNKYPYFLTILYYEEGKIFGFGDGKLLRPLQDMLNDLYDQMRRAARPNRVFFDPESEVDLADLDEDDGPVPCKDPNQTIKVVEVGRVNDAIPQLIRMVHDESQRVVRWSELMVSLATERKTATEAAIQQQQGVSGIDHKKLMLQETLIELSEYLLALMMEHYTEARAFRISEDKEEYAWIDFRQLNEVPVMVPTSSTFEREWRTRFPEKPVPLFQQLKDEKGKPLTKSVDLDIDITIGAGLPKNKAFLYQMLERLAPLSAAAKDGTVKPVLLWEELRKFIEDFLGLPLEEPQQVPVAAQPQTPQPQGALPNAVAQGLTAAGAPQPPMMAGGVR